MFAYIIALGSTLSVVITYGFGYIWCGFCLLTSYYGYPLREVKNEDKVKALMSKIKISAMKDENGKAKWWFIDKIENSYYIGTFVNTERKSIVYIMCNDTIFNQLTTISINNDTTNKDEKIELYERTGNYYWFEYSKRDLIVTKFNTDNNPNQEKIITETAAYLKKNNHCVVFIYGLPGTGKSMCGILLAKLIKAKLVRTFDPTQPGDNLSSLYATVEPTEENPLVIVLDEVNIMFHNVHNGLIKEHRDTPTQIINKPTLNRFLDDINLGIFPHLVIIMTSNISVETIEQTYDASYIRKGRVDLKFVLE
jgi:pyridoxal/pyridoxine/pyridoxamine kinase